MDGRAGEMIMATRFEVYRQVLADFSRAIAELDQVRASMKDIQLRELTT
jgi:hypothetical protein